MLFCVLKTAHAGILFQDDFEQGLDPNNWERENAGGQMWVEGADTNPQNKHITTQGINAGWQYADIVTKKDDFYDFTFNWKMRFNNEGYDRDHRAVYFRVDNSFPQVHGYYLNITVGYGNIGSAPKDYLVFQEHEVSGQYSSHSPCSDLGYDYFTLNEWYNFGMDVYNNKMKVKTWKEGDAKPDSWLLTAVDEDFSFASGRIGFGNYCRASTDVDNVTITPGPVSAALFLVGGITLAVRRRCHNRKQYA